MYYEPSRVKGILQRDPNNYQIPAEGTMTDSNHKNEQTVWVCKKCATLYQPHCRLIMKGETTNSPFTCPFMPELVAEWKEIPFGRFA